MKITTRTGDQGKTALLCGHRVPKYHPAIEAVGTLDEANAFLSLARAMSKDKCIKSLIRMILKHLSMLGTGFVVPKGNGKHLDSEFTHLQALKKATELYDKLIGGNKLDQSWETGLEKVEVTKRTKGNQTEVVVAFHRSDGDPKTVYIFFTQDGQYAGSNFTGR